MNPPPGLRQQLRPDDLLIAADGGLRHCQSLGLTPAVAIGDFDSIDTAQVQAVERAGVQVIRHPARKDQTDLELALLLAIERGARELLVLGALGQRWDQSLANLLLATHPGLAEAQLTLLDGTQRITAVRTRAIIHGEIGDTVSLIPLGGEATGVTTRGLEYGLQDGTLPIGSTLGVSNMLAARKAEVSVSRGVVLCVHSPREAGSSG
jgi:thiamine pyrophosphokinase